MKPYIVLDYYMPPPMGHFASKIANAILTKLKPFGLTPKLRGAHEDDAKAWGPQTTSIWSHWGLHAEVRRFAQHGQGSGWHKDGDLEPNPKEIMDHAAVLWAEVTPTEFKVTECPRVAARVACYECGYPASEAAHSTGSMKHMAPGIYRPEPGEIVIARNLGSLHRSPPDAPEPPARRWFFRQRVEVPAHLELP